MELIRGLHNLRDNHKGCVLTIGKFDGVHLGHKAVLKNLIAKARQLGLPATVMVFEPQPEELFSPETAPARLSTLREKYVQLRDIGIDRLLCLRFDSAFSNQLPEQFVSNLLVKRLDVKFLVVGDDFRFGKKRAGDFSFLLEAGKQNGFSVVSTQSFIVDHCRISSTAIRDVLAEGDFNKAQTMLGRPFAIRGRVVHGDKKGRTIGFPTANILLKRSRAPIAGVFAVKVYLNGVLKHGVANVGTRPTINGIRNQLEVHIFDLAENIYGCSVVVEPVLKIRDEKRFESFELLKQQIQVDAQRARDYLNSLSEPAAVAQQSGIVDMD